MAGVLLDSIPCDDRSPGPRESGPGPRLVCEWNPMIDRPRRPSPPLVDVRTIVPGIAVDVRLAGTGNATGAPVPGYDAPLALLRPSAAGALARAQRNLRGLGF